MTNQSRVIDPRRIAQRPMTHSVADDLFYFIAAIALFGQCGRHRLVDDFEISTTCEFFEFHQGKIWLNAGCVAIHDQANGASWGNHSGLGVAIPVFFPQRDGCIPALF